MNVTGILGVPCKPYRLGHSGSQSNLSYDENWLQKIIHENPSLLPIQEFEPSFEEIFPVAREVRTQAGLLDNLFVTPDGDLILVECKLWKNPEARRKVISQIIDYASAISDWSYDNLNDAINHANNTKFENALYEKIRNDSDILDEDVFVSNVIKNLRLGRHLLLIIGDGIRDDAERLTNFLQQRMDRHFMLGVLGLNIYKMPENEQFLIIPDIMLKTTIIERGVITLNNNSIDLIQSENNLSKQNKGKNQRSENLTDIKFFEKLGAVNANTEKWLKSVLARMEGLGITWEVKQSVIPRYSPDGEATFNLGYFRSDGRFLTNNATWHIEDEELRRLALEYISNISSLILNSYIKEAGKSGFKTFIGDKIINISDLIDKEDAFIEIVSLYISKIDKAVAGRI